MHKHVLAIMALFAAMLIAHAAGDDLTPPTRSEMDAARKQGRFLAVMTMENGTKIEMVLEGKEMPYTVANFVKLAKAKFYDGQAFFQVVDQPKDSRMPALKLWQTGDPNNDGSGSAGYTIGLEMSPFLRNKRGAVAMFHRPQFPESGSSQFIILGTDFKMVDGQLPTFGWVKNVDDLAKIKKGDKIKALVVTPYNGKEACPLYVETTASKWKAPTQAEISSVQMQGRQLATITLESGKKIEVVLEGGQMPLTVANFIKLAQGKFYDGLALNRLDQGPTFSLIEGGDPEGDGTGGPGYEIKYVKSKLLNKAGAFGMLPVFQSNSAASQFYIALSDLPEQIAALSPFGWVKSGMDALKDVKAGDKVKSITVARYEGAEANPLVAQVKESKWKAPTEAEVAAVKKQGRYLATITMADDKQVELVLEGKDMPNTVANFVKLAQAKFYDGLTFHRVETEKDFQLIQGGDPSGNGSGGPGYQINMEKSKLIHKTGALAMARSADPDSAGCQFYITYCDIPQLDGNYAVFGWVKSGLDVVKNVKVGDKMKSITVKEYDGKEACPVLATEGK